MVFTLAMVLNPQVWKRAQAQIDAVFGTERLPDFGDRAALPYVDAIIRETVLFGGDRWCLLVYGTPQRVATLIVGGSYQRARR